MSDAPQIWTGTDLGPWPAYGRRLDGPEDRPSRVYGAGEQPANAFVLRMARANLRELNLDDLDFDGGELVERETGQRYRRVKFLPSLESDEGIVAFFTSTDGRAISYLQASDFKERSRTIVPPSPIISKRVA